MSDVAGQLRDITLAMSSLNDQFQDEIEALRRDGRDEETIHGLVKGAAAMRDASGIYVAWAGHFVEKLTQVAGGADQEEEDHIIVEG